MGIQSIGKIFGMSRETGGELSGQSQSQLAASPLFCSVLRHGIRSGVNSLNLGVPIVRV